jgi:hypothetical protein
MSIDKTPEDQIPQAEANELDEAQLGEVAGGVIAIKGEAAADGSVRFGQPVTFTATVQTTTY